jgi:hypothetical protein
LDLTGIEPDYVQLLQYRIQWRMQYENQQCRKLLHRWKMYLGVANASRHGALALPHPGHPGVAGACESVAKPSGRDADGKRRTGKQARAGCGWKLRSSNLTCVPSIPLAFLPFRLL